MLDTKLFHFLRKKLHLYIVPQLDMFASPGNHQLKHFVFKVSTLAGRSTRCIKLPTLGRNPLLCQSPIESNIRMVKPPLVEPPFNMHDDNPLLGLNTMVAPTSKTSVPPHSQFFDKSVLGNVQKLPGAINATSKMAPSLHSVIRKALESKQIKAEDIDNYLNTNKSIHLYDTTFRLLWAICF